jgi:UDP-glucose 4-epimerase
MKVLVTGGAGYIGSTVCSALEAAGIVPIVLDSLVNGREEFVSGRFFAHADIGDSHAVKTLLKAHPEIACVIHCAAFIVVPDSVRDPGRYYSENVSKTVTLLSTLIDCGIERFIFSSSAAVYANTEVGAVTEASPVAPSSPYARSKLMVENILSDFTTAHRMRAIALRYFNPVGADPELRTGPYLNSPTHALGKIMSVHEGREEEFVVAGVDWATRDGSAVRDYIHVWDLAEAHVRAVQSFDNAFFNGETFRHLNLGTGEGCTVLELVRAFEKVSGRPLPWRAGARRLGDVVGAFANPALAAKTIGWRAQRSLEDAIRDGLRWNEIKKERLANERGSKI